MADFFYSYLGMYVTQSFLHGAIAALIVDRSIQAWNITRPLTEQRFRLLSILVPVFSFPAYQLINPERGSIPFRMDSLLDTSRWLHLELWGVVPLGFFFIVMIIITSAIFLLQEMIPIIRHMTATRHAARNKEHATPGPLVEQALAGLPGEKPDVLVVDEREPHLFSTTGSKPAIFLSSALVRMLTLEQMQAALAHELAHIRRSRRPFLVMIYLLRILMFFNPVVLLEFRRIAQGEEMICDDIAISETHNPLALADTLKHFYHPIENTTSRGKKPGHLGEKLEDHSHNLLLSSRIARLEGGSIRNEGGSWIPFILTAVVIVMITYFVM